MHRHVQIAQKQGRHREVSQKHKNSTESAPRERQGTPTRASGAALGTHKEASRAQKTPRRQYSGALAVPKCSKTHTLATSQRQHKTHPKLQRESQRAPNEGPVRPTAAQESSKRGSKGRQGHRKGSVVAPAPQNGSNMDVQRSAKKSRKSDYPRKHANFASTHYLPH